MNIKAIPTEYEGVTFRSKSEAIFARALDLAGITQWAYEFVPNGGWVAGDRYTPDFALVFNEKAVVLIEYKPAAVTPTYKKKLRDWVEEFRFDWPLILFQGGAYTESIDINILVKRADKAAFWKQTACFELIAKPVSERLAEAKNFRFDLAAKGAA